MKTPKEILEDLGTTQLDVYKHFVSSSIDTKKNVSSPFSEDSKPSFSIFHNANGIMYKCHSTGKAGNVFNLVAEISALDEKTQFTAVLDAIRDKLNLQPYKSKSNFKIDFPSIKVKPQYSPAFISYWLNIGVDANTLFKYGAFEMDSFRYEKNGRQETWKVFEGVVFIAYKTIDDNNNKVYWELYQPEQTVRGVKYPKFFSKSPNYSNIGLWGLSQVDYTEKYIILAAGKKDTLCAVANGFNTVSVLTENTFPTQAQIDELRVNYKFRLLFVIFDNEHKPDGTNPGQDAAIKLCSKYNLINIKIGRPPGLNKIDLAIYLPENGTGDLKKMLRAGTERNREINHLISEKQSLEFKIERLRAM